MSLFIPNVKRVFKENPGWMATILGIAMGLYGLFYAIYDDAFVDEGDWYRLPLQMTLRGSNAEITFPSLVREEREDSVLYVFVLDKSESIEGSIEKPQWYSNAIKKLIDKQALPEDHPLVIQSTSRTVPIFNAARVRLYEMLVDLCSINPNPSDNFSVWTLGDTGLRVFPDVNETDDEFARLSRRQVNHSIRTTQLRTDRRDPQTNFTDLLEKLLDEYGDEIAMRDNPRQPSLVVVILSDLLHDPTDNVALQQRREDIEQDWKALVEYIRRLAKGGIMAHLIVTTQEGLEEAKGSAHEHIYPVYNDFNKELDWDRLSESEVNQVLQGRWLYPTIRLEPVKFYYRQPGSVSDSMLISFPEVSDITIDIPAKLDSTPQPKVEFGVRVRSETGQNVRASGRVTLEETFVHEILNDRKLQLIHEGDRPVDEEGAYVDKVTLRLTHARNRSTYILDVRFVKLLPLAIAVLMLLSQMVSVLMVLSMLGVVLLRLGKWYRMRQRCRILIVGISGVGKTTLARHITKQPDEPVSQTKEFMTFEAHIDYRETGSGEPMPIPVVVSDYRGDELSEIMIDQDESFFGMREDRLVNAIIFLVDLFPARDEKGNKPEDEVLIRRYEHDAIQKLEAQIKENSKYLTSPSIESIMKLSFSKERLCEAMFVINKIDLLEKVYAKGYMGDAAIKDPCEFAKTQYAGVKETIITECQKRNIALSEHCISAIDKEKVDEITQLILGAYTKTQKAVAADT